MAGSGVIRRYVAIGWRNTLRYSALRATRFARRRAVKGAEVFTGLAGVLLPFVFEIKKTEESDGKAPTFFGAAISTALI